MGLHEAKVGKLRELKLSYGAAQRTVNEDIP